MKGKLLLVKPDHIGDFALLVPTLLGLLKTYGKDQIGVVTNSLNQQWREVLPEVGFWETIDFPGYERKPSNLTRKLRLLRDLARLGYRLRRRRVEIAVDLRIQPDDWRGKLVCRLSGALRRVGGVGTGSRFLTLVRGNETGHESNRLQQRVEFSISENLLESTQPWLRLQAGTQRIERRILIHPGAGFPSKKWPVAHWQRLLNLIRERLPTTEILLTGGPQDRELLQSIDPTGSIVCTKTIPEMINLIASARMLVALDSAAAHVAWLTSTPCVVIFSSANEPQRWGARGDCQLLTNTVPCSPCALTACSVPGHPCMTGISPERVVDVLVEQFNRMVTNIPCRT